MVDIRGSALPNAAKGNNLKFGAIMESLPVQRVCLFVCNQWAYADNCADAVDRLLIWYKPTSALTLSEGLVSGVATLPVSGVL